MENCNYFEDCPLITKYWGPKNKLNCMNTSDFKICLKKHFHETEDEYLTRIGIYDCCP